MMYSPPLRRLGNADGQPVQPCTKEGPSGARVAVEGTEDQLRIRLLAPVERMERITNGARGVLV